MVLLFRWSGLVCLEDGDVNGRVVSYPTDKVEALLNGQVLVDERYCICCSRDVELSIALLLQKQSELYSSVYRSA